MSLAIMTKAAGCRYSGRTYVKRTVATLCIALGFGLATTVAQAQTTCPADTVTGNAVAQMISPANGSTLPADTVIFTWCNANADYFLTVESVVGAHDIFFAFVGGAGPGAGVETLKLGPACATASPTGCIPARGETIHVTLWTFKQGQNLPPSPFQYTYTAASPALAHQAINLDNNGKLEIMLYPAGNRLSAVLPEYFRNMAARAAVYSIKGQEIMEQNVSSVNGRIAVQIGKLARGIYLFEIYAGGKRSVQPFNLSH